MGAGECPYFGLIIRNPDNEWMMAFMKGVEERGLRVDFVCMHSYGGPIATSKLFNPDGSLTVVGKAYRAVG